MYYLCHEITNMHNSSVIGHPVNAIFQSKNLDEIADKLKDCILDGNPADEYHVFEVVIFNAQCDVQFENRKKA